jgi:glycosyl transferase family 25
MPAQTVQYHQLNLISPTAKFPDPMQLNSAFTASEAHIEKLATYVINLDRSPERLSTISARLAALGIKFTRIPAVDAQRLTPAQSSALDEETYKLKHGKTPLLGELGCYLSHVETINAFIESGAEFALILEDDTTPTESLIPALQGLIAHADRWDMVKFSGVHSGTPQPYLEVCPGHWLSVMLTRCTGSSAYLINRKAALAYRSSLLPMELPYDHVFDQGWRFGIKVRLLSPTPCIHDDITETTIVSTGPSRKFHWSRRFPMLRYRLKTELRRLVYGISETVREKRASNAG